MAGLALALADRERRLATTNSEVDVSGVALPVPPGRERCFGPLFVARGTVAVRLFVGPTGGTGPPLELSIRADGREIAAASHTGGYGEQPLALSLPEIEDDLYPATVCVHNAGRRSVALAGNRTSLVEAMEGRFEPAEQARFDFLRSGRESVFERLPAVARRASLLKASFVGAWTIWLALALVGAAGALALWLTLREVRR